MSQQQKHDRKTTTQHVRCKLYNNGCRTMFLPNELDKHLTSDEHLTVLLSTISSMKDEHDNNMIDDCINPQSIHNSVPKVNSYLKLILAATEAIDHPRSTPNVGSFRDVANQPSPTNHRVNAITMRNTIIADRYNVSNIESLNYQEAINETTMVELSRRIISLSSMQPTHNSVQQTTEESNAASCPASNTDIDPLMLQVRLLKNQVEDSPVTTDGVLIWGIDDLCNKIGDALTGKKSFITSPAFQTSMNGHSLFAKLYLAGKNDRRYISIDVHLNFPVQKPFMGRILTALVDQSNTTPLKHIQRSFSAKLNNVNDFVDFDRFAEINTLHKEQNPYTRGDKIWIIVVVQQTNEEKYANHPANIKDCVTSMLNNLRS